MTCTREYPVESAPPGPSSLVPFSLAANLQRREVEGQRGSTQPGHAPFFPTTCPLGAAIMDGNLVAGNVVLNYFSTLLRKHPGFNCLTWKLPALKEVTGRNPSPRCSPRGPACFERPPTEPENPRITRSSTQVCIVWRVISGQRSSVYRNFCTHVCA